ncbi:MAG: hypothetical protein LKI94_08310 [Sporolactobacillus sp.]|jgi:hypothetical protein|nr:hypothetical protein [Sporolactobacillus sp.]
MNNNDVQNNGIEDCLNQLLTLKSKMRNDQDKVTLQEFIIELRHLLNSNDPPKRGALKKFNKFIDKVWPTLSPIIFPVLSELAKRFLFYNNDKKWR